ncbi:sulfatase-like hydrolase/transferase [Akkermansiaceae bacterium]|nr:sulfatase-like hydrolase/transferase [Akkermansiaceae bacterium]
MSRALFLALLLPLQAVEKPNILFIFADDMTYEAIGALGHQEIKTPNLDKLVHSGTTFTHAYNPGGWNGAICVASRAMIMSGRQLWYAEKEASTMKKDLVAKKGTWPQMLSGVGYETYMTGKWHIQIPPADIFDHVGDVRPGMPGDRKNAYNRPLDGKPDTWSPTDREEGGFWKGGKHWSEVEADTAIGYLDHAKKSEKPFFIYLAFNAPHDPRQAPQEYLDLYPTEGVQVPENLQPLYPHRNVMQAGRNLRDEALAPFPRTTAAIQTHLREYYALISHLDAQIGRVIDQLEKNGQRENTYIVFTADHGLSVGHHGLVGKQNMYDHSIRVPFVISGPELEEGRKIDHGIYLQDIVPTSLEIAGAEIPEHVQFQSLVPIIEGSSEGRGAIYTGYRMSQRQITEGDYKLIVYPMGEVARLFNLKDDPSENNDLLEHDQGRDKARELLKKLKALQKTVGDELDLGSYPDLTIGRWEKK